MTLESEIATLHQSCGVYTRPAVGRRILDSVKWTANANLLNARLLEPAAGDGVFLVEAVRRLIVSFRRRGIPTSVNTLGDRIRAFELHEDAYKQCQRHVIDTLIDHNVNRSTINACMKRWLAHNDYLLSNEASSSFSHVVGNPPYIRWSKIPNKLRTTYESHLQQEMVGGDLFIPFLDLALEHLRPRGMLGVICSDRWRYMAFAEAFRHKWLQYLNVIQEQSISAGDAFETDVSSYPSILIASKRSRKRSPNNPRLRNSVKTIGALGYQVKVGPALGHTPAFVLKPNENDVESEVLFPWVDSSEITEGGIESKHRRVVSLWDEFGKLLDLSRFPKLTIRLTKFKNELRNRSIVQNGAPWYRTIDRVMRRDWERPKLLVPELAKIPRVVLDSKGLIPSHGVYVIFAPDDNIEPLYDKLRDGQLATGLRGIAPKVNGDYTRCYKRFLLNVKVDSHP